MKIKTIKSEGLAHNSYYISDENEAAVIDPRRDSLIYYTMAQQECTKIKYIFETHRNEDYIIGSLELQNTTGAEICHSKELSFKYGDHNLSDAETLQIGKLKIEALYTPGHTNESMCYAVYAPENRNEPLFIFTGDTLFVGSVGRTDLYGKTKQLAQAEKLYHSIHEKLLPLGNGSIIYPSHGAGSICGNIISDREYSTIGYERKINPSLWLNKDEFIKQAENEEFLVPPYFKKMEEYNLNGPPLIKDRKAPRALNLKDFELEANQANTIIVDTRMPYAFAGSFIPGSLSLWLDGTSVYPGWILNYGQRLLFIHERPEDMKLTATHFWRLGFDCMIGFLCSGINEWQEQGKNISSLGTLSASELRTKLITNELTVLDVREPSEWKEGYIEGAKRMYFGHLANKADSLTKNKPIAIICSVGNRASIAASILIRQGFKNVHNVLGGMTSWNNLGYPIKKD